MLVRKSRLFRFRLLRGPTLDPLKLELFRFRFLRGPTLDPLALEKPKRRFPFPMSMAVRQTGCAGHWARKNLVPTLRGVGEAGVWPCAGEEELCVGLVRDRGGHFEVFG